MAQEHAAVPGDAADDRVDGRVEGGPAVVEWGDTGARPAPRLPRGLGHVWSPERRGPLLAAVSALTLFGSLVADWRVWTFPADIPPGRVVQGVVSFPVVGTAYMIGLFALVASGGLALFGTGPVRRHARLVGLAVVGVLGAVLVATVASLDQVGGNFEDFWVVPRTVEDTGTPPTIEYGRGLYLAFAGVAAAALALYLAAPGRPAVVAEPAAEPVPARSEPTGGTAPGWAPEDDGDDEGDDWPWRPREGRTAPAQGGPVDLTVEPAAPFLPPGEGPRRD